MRPSSGTIVAHLVGAAITTLALWAVGLDLLHSLVLGTLLVAVVGLRLAPAAGTDQSWPPLGEEHSDTGVRREIARLSWSMQGYEARVQRHPVRRLHDLAAFRLGERGLDLDDPRDYLGCQSALGAVAYRVVSEPDERPVYADFLAAVDAVEGLQPTATSRRRPRTARERRP